ncbi:endochitinase 1 [Rhypophila decipiens]|uniref:chitinase n=1 Tax=Rhypophila decipiens TaxID=261697 RepID=A0AAN7BBH3_9PEZI|nr:endochitinase 1 [Rhypophila decipiens]
MVYPALLLVSPLFAAVPALAAPKVVQLAAQEQVQIQCAPMYAQTVVVTTTVVKHWPPKGTGEADQGVERFGPDTTAAAQPKPQGDQSTPVPVVAPAAQSPSPPTTNRVPNTQTPQTSSGAANIPNFNVTAEGAPPSSYRNALYFTNWGIYGANFQPQQLPASQISHVLYAFADIAYDGEVKTSDSYADLEKHYPTDSWNDQGKNAYGCVKQMYILKKKNRNMKVLLSIGGWTYSPKFVPIAATEAGRQRFASSAVKLVQDWGFDGIDIDWEYPTNANEARDFVLLLQACRTALDQYAAKNAPNYHFLITVAAAAGPQHYANMDLKGMDAYVDAWHMMAYDYAGSWDTTSGHQSNIFSNTKNPQSTKFNTEQAVHDYVTRGIAVNKIVLGLPLYGRSFEATTGLGQPYNGIGAGSIQSGVWLYKDLPRPGASEVYDDVAMASYSYDPANKELISYDTVNSAMTKAKYLVKKGLGGAVFWEASGDKSGASSLVATLAKEMGKLDPTQNLLSFPVSQYDNIRKGMPGE